jgi:SAM-dependent methyltransferase
MDNLTIERWISDEEIGLLEHSSYWNDEEVEKGKEWYVLDDDFTKMEQYLEKRGFFKNFFACCEYLSKRCNRTIGGVGVDLAAGNLWAVPHLLKCGNVEKIYCVEYSKHRLLKLGPKLLEHYKVQPDKVVLTLGSFNDIKLASNTADFLFLSAAFHHASDPCRLLSEMRRVLKPQGLVVIIGEHVLDWPQHLTAALKSIVKVCAANTIPPGIQLKFFKKIFHNKRLSIKPDRLFPNDDILGDRYYTLKQYREMFSKYDFNMKRVFLRGYIFQSFVLISDKRS